MFSMCSCFCATFVCNWDCLILSTFQMDGLDVEIEPELGICELVASLLPRCFQCKCSSLISIAFNDAP